MATVIYRLRWCGKAKLLTAKFAKNIREEREEEPCNSNIKVDLFDGLH